MKLPPGVGNAFSFQVFNTISFSIALATPMLLYFKYLGASGTVIGIVAAMPALLNILQIPAARFVERIGYRAFVLRGWSLRSVFILGMAAIAFLPPNINAPMKMALMLMLLFAFNVSRGISVCGFLPWITQWIPERVRGRYISRDQMCSALASVGTMLIAAAYLRHESPRVSYGVVFLGSFMAAIVSLLFLLRIPDVPPPPRDPSEGPVPWREMMFYPPFFRLLVYDFVIFTALAGSGVFWVPCLRDQFQLTDSQILVFGSVTPIVMACCLFFLGKLVDRTGSRPILALANLLLIIHLCSWGALAAKLIPLGIGSVILIQATAGAGIAALNLANQRLAMSIVPPMGRSHFFALFSVINGLTFGITPVLWGMALDKLAGWQHDWLYWQWNNFSVLYLALAAVAIIALIYRARLTEPRAMTTEQFFRDLFLGTPTRAISRLLMRRPFS